MCVYGPGEQQTLIQPCVWVGQDHMYISHRTRLIWWLFFKFLCHLTSHPEIQPVFRCLRVNLVYIDIHIYIYIYKTIIYDQRDCKEVLQLALSDSLMHKCELWVLNFKEKRDVKNQSQIENSSFSLLSFFPTKKIPRYCFHPQSCISSPPHSPKN